jgi:hypothetical protein
VGRGEVMAFDPSTAKSITAAFDPGTATPITPVNQSQPSQPVQSNGGITGMETGINNSLSVPITAALSNAGANVLESGVDAAAWVGEKIGLIKPQIASEMKRIANEDITAKFRSGTMNAPQQDPFTQGVYKYPAVAAVSQAVPEIYGLAKTAITGPLSAAPKAGMMAKMATTLGNTAIQGAGNAVINAGIAGPDTKSQDFAAALSMVLSPAVQVTSYGIQQGAKALGLESKLKALVAPLSKDLLHNNHLSMEDKAAQSINNTVSAVVQQENKNWAAIKEIPGTINSQPIINKTQNIISNSKISMDSADDVLKSLGNPSGKYSTLSDPQINALVNIQKQASNITNMDQALKLKRQISGNKSLFEGSKVSDDLYNSYKELISSVDDAIQVKASTAGLDDIFKTANKYHREVAVPLQDSGAFDIASAVVAKQAADKAGKMVPPEYAKVTNRLIAKYKTPQQMKQLVSMLDDDAGDIIANTFVLNTFKDIMDSPETIDMGAALIKTNKFLNTYERVLPESGQKTLRGIQILMKEAGTLAKTKSGENSQYFLHTLGGAIGGGVVGNMVGGGVGATLGAAVGIGLAPKVAQTVQNFSRGLMDTKVGQQIVQSIADDPRIAKQVLQAIGLAPAAVMSTKEGR